MVRLPADLPLRLGLWIDTVVDRDDTLRTLARERAFDRLRRDDIVSQRTLERWRTEAAAALRDPHPITAPYGETLLARDGSVDTAPHVFSLTLAAERVLRIATTADDGARGGLLVDVFEGGNVEGPRRIGAYGPAPFDERLSFEQASVDRKLTLRVQALPGSTGRFAWRTEVRAVLDFPVEIDTTNPVQSFFGMPRDGGRREHHGIDIFAPRGTPVLAAADGLVIRTGESPRGGLHVWQRAVDTDGVPLGALYYAHMDSVTAEAGTHVRRGEPLGTVGNTGNAQTTPPHLHFGLYRRFVGPVDPLPLTGERRVPTVTVSPTNVLPNWLAVSSTRANLRGAPSTDAPVIASLDGGSLLRVEASVDDGRWARVTVGDGARGFIARSLLAPAREHEVQAAINTDAMLRSAPSADAPSLGRFDADLRDGAVSLGRFGEAERVRTTNGLTGWLIGPAVVPALE